MLLNTVGISRLQAGEDVMDLDILARLNFAAACADSMSAFQASAARELGEAPEAS